jgi:hypothetical protein
MATPSTTPVTYAPNQFNFPAIALQPGRGNIGGTQLGVSTLANFLNTDGRSLTIDPQVAKTAQTTINKNTPKLTKAQTTLTNQQSRLKTLQEQLAAATPGTKQHNNLSKQIRTLTGQISKTQTAVTRFQGAVDSANTRLQSGPSITETFKKADPETYAALDRARGFSSQIGQINPQSQAYLSAAGAGYQSRDIGQNNIAAAQIGAIGDVSSRDIAAARLGQIADIRAQQAAAAQARAQQTGISSLGGQLQQTAAERLALGGRLSEAASRDAIQAARAGMAARGMATGNSALAAELLNRDRYSQQRFLENAGFATGVEGQDLSRRLANTSETNQIAAANMAEANRIALANQQANLAAQQANQQTAFNREQANASLAQQAALANQESALRAATQNQNTALSLGQSNAQLAQQSSLANQANTFNTATFNENNRLAGTQQNLNQLSNAANFVTDQNVKGMAANMDMATASTNSNPLMRTLGLAQQDIFGTSSLGTIYANNQAALEAAKITGNATQQAGWMNLGGSALGALGDIGGGFASASDRRLKKDIQPIGKDPLGLTTYQYRFKGEPSSGPKHTGYMAQEVRKVVPEAVTTFQHNGKTRLAIKPRILGQAIASELASEQRHLFRGGYVVGSGALSR